MRFLHFIGAVICLSLIACSALDPCQNKDLFIQKHKEYVEESVKNKSDYSDEEWELRDDELDKLVNECYKNVEEQMSKEEKKEFWITNSKYLALRMKKNSENSLEAFSDLIKSISGDGTAVAEGMKEIFGDDLKGTLEDFEGDISEIFDEDFKDKLEEVFDEDFRNDLKDAFENLGEKLKEMGEELKEIVEEEN